jgi:hypothetical protein
MSIAVYLFDQLVITTLFQFFLCLTILQRKKTVKKIGCLCFIYYLYALSVVFLHFSLDLHISYIPTNFIGERER